MRHCMSNGSSALTATISPGWLGAWVGKTGINATRRCYRCDCSDCLAPSSSRPAASWMAAGAAEPSGVVVALASGSWVWLALPRLLH